ncbi:type II toxin-antitoxin system HigB family toxin [Pseudomonas sp. SIMBA_067]|uniref:type II toxin-antitoxin system HigB family toxin n=1 Tax=Pseudomonas sp. SIMBA_067 TaxID=3085807 RepID=UPI00397A828B
MTGINPLAIARSPYIAHPDIWLTDIWIRDIFHPMLVRRDNTMRVITKAAVTKAIEAYGQWKAPLSLWLTTFDRATLRFESFEQLRQTWATVSGWNVDRIPHSKLRPASRKGPLDIYVFDIKKNECRLIAWLNARTGTLYIKAILSHAEYDKWCRSDIR